ncbi:MAG TPA: peptide deformylase [Longimicrobiales bacterium]|nr:peptide deformylase [Longimicrobiales bacterium]
MEREILLLGDSRLGATCRPVTAGELDDMAALGRDLQDTLRAFRRQYGAGRGIAAPQIGAPVRVVYLEWPEPRVLLNPELHDLADETFELWDDCMSFPELMVRVRRHASCLLRYRDLNWTSHEERAHGDLAELLQHEVDHLDGVLAVSRAVHPQAFALRRQLEQAGELPARFRDPAAPGADVPNRSAPAGTR